MKSALTSLALALAIPLSFAAQASGDAKIHLGKKRIKEENADKFNLQQLVLLQEDNSAELNYDPAELCYKGAPREALALIETLSDNKPRMDVTSTRIENGTLVIGLRYRKDNGAFFLLSLPSCE